MTALEVVASPGVTERTHSVRCVCRFCALNRAEPSCEHLIQASVQRGEPGTGRALMP